MNIQRVPAYLEVDGKKLEIGTGLVDNDMRCVEISVDPNLSSLIRDQIIDGVSVGSTSIDLEKGCTDHKPVQHRDAKPPWCNKCGLTLDYELPIGRFGNIRSISAETGNSDHDFTD